MTRKENQPLVVFDSFGPITTTPDFDQMIADERARVQRLMEQVKENHRKLDSCPGHDFSEPVGQPWVTCEDGTRLYREYRCTQCGGSVDSIHKQWYERGRQHAQRGTDGR